MRKPLAGLLRFLIFFLLEVVFIVTAICKNNMPLILIAALVFHL